MTMAMVDGSGASLEGAQCTPPVNQFDDEHPRLPEYQSHAPFEMAAALEFDDATLLRFVAANSDQALHLLYRRHATLVYSLALRMLRNQAWAEEVVQETFIRVWRAARVYDPARGAVNTWIATIARNLALSMLRGQRLISLDDHIEQVAAAPDERTDPEMIAWRHARRDMVRGALKQLPKSQRIIVMLAYYQGLTHAEIAERTGVPLGTVKSRLRLALGRLSVLLGPALEGKEDRSAREARR